MNQPSRLRSRTLIDLTAHTIAQGLTPAEQAESKSHLDTGEKRQRFADGLQDAFAAVLRHHPLPAQTYFCQAVTAKLYLLLEYNKST